MFFFFFFCQRTLQIERQSVKKKRTQKRKEQSENLSSNFKAIPLRQLVFNYRFSRGHESSRAHAHTYTHTHTHVHAYTLIYQFVGIRAKERTEETKNEEWIGRRELISLRHNLDGFRPHAHGLTHVYCMQLEFACILPFYPFSIRFLRICTGKPFRPCPSSISLSRTNQANWRMSSPLLPLFSLDLTIND